MADVRRAYGEYTTDIQRIYDERSADIRRTYGEQTLKNFTAKRLTNILHCTVDFSQ